MIESKPGSRAGAIIRAYRTNSAAPAPRERLGRAGRGRWWGMSRSGADSSVFYGSVLRGDVESIRIGERTNIQDQATLHVTSGRSLSGGAR